MPWVDLDDIIAECALAMIENSDRTLPVGLDRAVIRDVKDVFRSRKWTDSTPKGLRHIRLMSIEPPRSPEDGYINDVAIAQFLEALPCHGREMVELYYVQEWTQKEIAERLGIGPSMVSRYLTRMIA